MSMITRIASFVRRPRSPANDRKHQGHISWSASSTSDGVSHGGSFHEAFEAGLPASDNPIFAAARQGHLFASATHIVVGTRHSMEDFNVSVSMDDNTAFFAVFDGHGGAECAEFFSRELPLLVRDALKGGRGKAEWGAALKSALAQCGSMWDSNLASPRSCGCVVTALLVSGLDYTVAHVGDCGLAASVSGPEHALMVTSPHHITVPSEAERATQAGARVEDERLLGVLKPSRAFGNLDVRALPGGSALISECDIRNCTMELDAEGKGFLVLASDGLWDVLDAKTVGKHVRTTLARTGSVSQAAKVVALAAARSNVDDCTVTVLSFAAN